MTRKQHLETVLEKSFKELGNDKRLIFFSLALTHKTSGPSAIKEAIEKGKGYSEVMLLYDLENYLLQKFKIEKKDIITLYIKYKIIVGRIDSSEDIFIEILKEVEFRKFCQVLFNNYSTVVIDEINYQIRKMRAISKAITLVFLRNWKDLHFPVIGSNPSDFNDFINKKYRSYFGEELDLKIIPTIGSILIRAGLLFESTWVRFDASESSFLYQFPEYLNVLENKLISDLLTDKSIQKRKRRKNENIVAKDTTYGKIKVNNASFLKNSQVEILKRMEITQKLNLFANNPSELKGFLEKVLESELPDKEKADWVETVREVLYYWSIIEPSGFRKFGKVFLGVLEKWLTPELVDFSAKSASKLYNWLSSKIKR